MTMTWENGRQLKELVVNDDLTVSYKYNSNGIRTQKSINGNKKYIYHYDSNNNLTALADSDNNIMQFYYDNEGKVSSMRYKGITYYYVKNLQGDVTKLIKSDGTTVANYTYNPWGEKQSITDASGNNITDNTNVALVNPFRYRGYVYDDETGLYYLMSRYYDPTTQRFINADVYTNTQTDNTIGANMFAYCENNSVSSTDVYGTKSSHLKTKINNQVWVTDFDGPTYGVYNCYSYALRKFSRIYSPGEFAYINGRNYKDANDIANLVLKDLKKLRKPGRILRGKDAKPSYRTDKKHYLIAIRVTGRNSRYAKDYHFMRRTADGCWRFKAGQYGRVMQLVGRNTPETVSWDLYKAISARNRNIKNTFTYRVAYKNVYTSKIIYMVVPY